MEIMNSIFSFYDKLIANFTPTNQALISLAILLFLIWQIYLIVKNGHWIFIVALIVLLPGTWPAARHIGNLIITLIKFLFIRVLM